MLADLVGFVGHRVHLVRSLEVRQLFDWAGSLEGRRLLDVAGGDGYWAGLAAKKGAHAVALDIDERKLLRGRAYSARPALVRGDALSLPFGASTFDLVISVCAIEHFADGDAAIREMARILRPGGDLFLSADSLSRASLWPRLAAAHRQRYSVVRTYDHVQLSEMLRREGFEILRHAYIFKGERGEQLYLRVSRVPIGWNLAAPFAPIIARSDHRNDEESGSVVLIHARKVAPIRKEQLLEEV